MNTPISRLKGGTGQLKDELFCPFGQEFVCSCSAGNASLACGYENYALRAIWNKFEENMRLPCYFQRGKHQFIGENMPVHRFGVVL
jgi:hypothetical protein